MHIKAESLHPQSDPNQEGPGLMQHLRTIINLILINEALHIGVAIPHLIDDFLYGKPNQLGLSNMTALVLSGFFAAALIWSFAQFGRGNKAGLFGAGFLLALLALAGVLKHIPLLLQPGAYWK